ncbi:hypothetical protein [Rugamonas apoptosis]|uniref:Uncharacterized protein n=1 Tax=Rugamonas apoptosis TaxID=2758570 RepID=A0A7W2FCW1_9BURK|nr:hypothetical protein [Rugamonas apoptosis]MBA5689392.1 hypothetical protein [Rugamonas apoptosis]
MTQGSPKDVEGKKEINTESLDVEHYFPKERNEKDSRTEILNRYENYVVWSSENSKRAAKVSNEAAKRAALESELILRRYIRNVLFARKKGGEAPKIESAPGYQIFKMLEMVCSKKTVEHVIEPLHAEFLHEYYQALEEKRKYKAAIINVKMKISLVYCVVSSKFFEIVGKCIQAAFKAKIGK